MNPIPLILLLLSVQPYIIEMITEPQNKTCVSEIFNAGEPISIRAKMTESPQKRYSLYLTIENESNVLLAHTRHNIESNSTLLTYNNDLDQTLSICIDNFETFPVTVELDIKFRHHLASLDTSPTVSEYAEIENKIGNIQELIQRGFSYFTQNEDYVDKIVSQGSTLENSLVIISIITLVLMACVGALQVLLIKHDLRSKKLF